MTDRTGTQPAEWRTTSSFWAFNTQAARLQDRAALIEYYRINKPTWGLVMGDVQLARDIKAASPITHVIVRIYKPDGFWYDNKSPEDYLKFMDEEHVDDNLWCYVENEAGINPAWNKRLVEANLKRSVPRKLVICNLSVGTPARPNSYIEDLWKEAEPLLKLLNVYREWLVLGLHEYFNCVPTSGFIGGWPDHAGVAPGQPGGRDLVTYSKWPLRAEAQTLSKFHCGRFEFLNNACKQLGIPPPRIVLTEHGQDDVSDIKAWVEKTVGQNIRGFRTLRDWWFQHFGWTLDRAYYEMLVYLRNSVYAGTNVEGALIYCYGNNGDPVWLPFNVEGSGLVEWLQEPDAPEAPTLPAFPPDFDARKVSVSLTSATTRTYIREFPSTTSLALGSIPSEATLGWYIPTKDVRPEEAVVERINGITATWLPVEVNGVKGWIFGGAVVISKPAQPPQPVLDVETVYNQFSNIRVLCDEALKNLEPYRKGP